MSRRPSGNVVAALPLTVLDRSRDALDRLARGGPGPARRGAIAASRALAAVAGAIEHVPPLTRGEDPSTHAGR